MHKIDTIDIMLNIGIWQHHGVGALLYTPVKKNITYPEITTVLNLLRINNDFYWLSYIFIYSQINMQTQTHIK
mgnify:CR=1 FL=1